MFSVRVDQNPYLPPFGRDVSAIVTVTADAPFRRVDQRGGGLGDPAAQAVP
jgi:hypothetical protein